MSNAVVSASHSISSAALISIVAFNPYLAFLLIRIFSNIFVLSMLAGVELHLPHNTFLTANKAGLVPFKIHNPLAGWLKSDDCKVSFEMQKKEVQCNILSNYGEDSRSSLQ